mmetsp:Transcript_4925/g.10871  ORF Transcript_4925/g.10871 Transcript_4925/m.10871 type:complete len:239 (-) Transcript_4925:139-855(-)
MLHLVRCISTNSTPILSCLLQHEGCTNVAVRQGMCKSHGAGSRICGVDGCSKVAAINGMCKRHQVQVPDNGLPLISTTCSSVVNNYHLFEPPISLESTIPALGTMQKAWLIQNRNLALSQPQNPFVDAHAQNHQNMLLMNAANNNLGNGPYYPNSQSQLLTSFNHNMNVGQIIPPGFYGNNIQSSNLLSSSSNFGNGMMTSQTSNNNMGSLQSMMMLGPLRAQQPTHNNNDHQNNFFL